MLSVPVRFVTSAVVLATIVATAVQPSYAAPLSQSEARVLCVNGAAGPTGAPCANADAYTTIQAAVDAAQSGDEIRIAKGVYVESDEPSDGNVVMIEQESLKLVGGFDSSNWTTPGEASSTVIDGQDQVRGITAGEGDIELEHLTITRGSAVTDAEYSAAGYGGAIYANTVSLQNVVLRDNQASNQAGGISAFAVIMTDTQVINNVAGKHGGGISAITVAMTDTQVINNRAGETGGGVLSRTSEAIDSVITNNSAYDGGGVMTGVAVIERSRIEGNHAKQDGGGLHLSAISGRIDDSIILNSVISSNTADKQGGGLYAYDGGLDVVSTVFGNNTAGIEGDAIYAGDASAFSSAGIFLRNTTIASVKRASHEAINLKGDGTLLLFDTVITNHAVGVALAEGSNIYGDYNAFFNNGTNYMVNGATQPLPFANVVTVDPQFIDPTAGNFHLQPSSPLIDVGDPSREAAISPLDDQRDIDGETVPWGGRADIGADEVMGTPRVFAPLMAR